MAGLSQTGQRRSTGEGVAGMGRPQVGASVEAEKGDFLGGTSGARLGCGGGGKGLWKTQAASEDQDLCFQVSSLLIFGDSLLPLI